MKKTLLFFLVILTIAISYGQTLKMYFWHDDYTHLYFAQEKIRPDFPYHINTYIVYQTNYLFGKNPFYYHLFGIILFAICVFAFHYLLTKLAVVNHKTRYLLTLFFASGYVGQESLFMFAGDGAGVLVGLALYLFTISFLLDFHQTKDKKSFIFSLIFFFLTLEAASHRFVGIIIPVLAIELLNFNKKRVKQSFAVVFSFIILFFVQYLFHPLSLVIRYGTSTFTAHPSNLPIFRVNIETFITNLFANFGNSLVPSHLQADILKNSYFVNKFDNILPFILPVLMMIILSTVLKLLFKKNKNVLIYWLIFVVGSLMLTQNIENEMLLVSFLVGYSLSLFSFLSIIFSRKKQILIVYSIVVGAAFELAILKPEFYILSDYRYMMTLSFVGPLFIAVIFFLISKGNLQNMKAKYFLELIVFLFVGLHLYYAVTSQHTFIQKFSQPAERVFKTIREEVTLGEGPVIIFTDASTRDLQYSVGDASRVGQLAPESAFAYNLGVSMDKIIWPKNLSNIYPIYNKQNLPIGNIYSFMVTQNLVIDTSQRLRESLLWNTTRSLDPEWEKETDSIKANMAFFDINSMAPMNVIVKLENATLGSTINVSWEYDTYGSIFNKKETKSVVQESSEGIYIQFDIPPGGTLLKEIDLQGQENINASKVFIRPNFQKVVI